MTVKFYQIDFNVIFFSLKNDSTQVPKKKKYTKYVNQQTEGNYLIW